MRSPLKWPESGFKQAFRVSVDHAGQRSDWMQMPRSRSADLNSAVVIQQETVVDREARIPSIRSSRRQ